jgi:hypothetical protein
MRALSRSRMIGITAALLAWLLVSGKSSSCGLRPMALQLGLGSVRLQRTMVGFCFVSGGWKLLEVLTSAGLNCGIVQHGYGQRPNGQLYLQVVARCAG